MKGKGKLTLTGKLGEIMQESAQAALSFIRSQAKRWNLNEDFFKDKEIHMHVPEGAVPKDGPSAGLTMLISLLSALTGRAVKRDVALTGEITLRGRVLPIGGFKEKVLAAHRAGMKMVLFPYENRSNLEEIPKNIQKKMRLIPIKSIDEAINLALVKTVRPRGEARSLPLSRYTHLGASPKEQ